MTSQWQRLHAELQHLDAYIALLQSNELPATIVHALETPLSTADTHAVISLLTEMIAVKWRLDGHSVEPNARHMVEVAHDWAVDTLLDLQTPLQVPSVSTNSDVQQHQLCRDLLTAVTSSLAASNPPTLRPLDTRDVLESAAELLDRDEWVELLVAAMEGTSKEAPALGAKARCRLLQREEASGRWLLDALPWTARVSVWASEPSIWRAQLTEWLLLVHQRPLVAIRDVLGRSDGDSDSVGSTYPHLYVLLLDWFKNSAAKWLGAVRSVELLSALSRLTRVDADANAFGRTIWRAAMPSAAMLNVVSQQSSATQRRLFQRLPTRQLLQRPLSCQLDEWLAVAERPEVLQCGLVLLVQPRAMDEEENSYEDVLAFLSWWFRQTHRETVESTSVALAETATGLRQHGAGWLRANRASFASLPMLRLRLTWMWVLVTVLGGAMELTATTEVLETLEYIYRRFAPTEPHLKSRFHTELIATFLFDLEWRWSLEASRIPPTAEAPADELLNWLRKLVQLLQLEQSKEESSTSTALTDALEQRLQKMLHM